jgi:hypothetical protein
MTRVPVRITRGLVPPGAAAWVPARRTIIIAPGAVVTERLLAHELAHVKQAETRPWPLAYALQWAVTGMSYTRMPFEVEARAAEGHAFYRAWARDLLTQGGAWRS